MHSKRDYNKRYVDPRGDVYHHFLTGEIKEGPNTLELIKDIKAAGPEDVVNIYINSPGGEVYCAMQIINAMRNSRCQVNTHAEGQVASAAGLIFFSGDGLAVADLSTFMLHDASAGFYGKTSEARSYNKDLESIVYKLCHTAYEPYITPEEIDKVLSGTDMYLTSEQVVERIKRVFDNKENNNNNEDIRKQQKQTRKPKAVGGKTKPTK